MSKSNIFIGIVVSVLYSSLIIPHVFATDAGSMIAIIITSDYPTLENNLTEYNTQYSLTACTIANGCLEVVKPFGISNSDLPSSSDVQFYVDQAHQANPAAKILVVEAKSMSWEDKWNAAHYAENLPQVEKITSISYSKVIMEIGLVLRQS